jgi:hypothetical protein
LILITVQSAEPEEKPPLYLPLSGGDELHGKTNPFRIFRLKVEKISFGLKVFLI